MQRLHQMYFIFGQGNHNLNCTDFAWLEGRGKTNPQGPASEPIDIMRTLPVADDVALFGGSALVLQDFVLAGVFAVARLQFQKD